MAKKKVGQSRDNFPSAPPRTVDVLVILAKALVRKISRADDRVPRDPNDLAYWWMKMQSPPNEQYDKPKEEARKDGTGPYWKTPYTDRIGFNLVKFVEQDKGFQGLIIAAAEEGFFWRNDSRSFFMKLISENDKMKKVGVKKYRKETLQKMGKLKIKV